MPVITYPGVTGVIQLTAITQVGISPAPVVLTCYPDSNPVTTGTLRFGHDGGPVITLPDCMVESTEEITSESEHHLLVRLLDRRWKWRTGYPMNGAWNQTGEARKLIPWTVRSPWQLAYLLLQAMGELWDPMVQIDLPAGLAGGDMIQRGPLDTVLDPRSEYLRLGENYAPSGTNPQVVWAAQPAALALADLADTYGRAVVLNHVDNRVYLSRIGIGADPPAGLKMSAGSILSRDAIPANVNVRGAATRYNPRLRLRAVGRDWDGSYRPLDMLTYAPNRAGQAMVVRYSLRDGSTFDDTKSYGVELNGVAFLVGAGDVSLAAACTTLATAINASASPRITGRVTASAVGATLVITAVVDGEEFIAKATGTGTASGWWVECTAGPITGPRDIQPTYLVAWGALALGDGISVTINGTAYAITVGAAGGAAAIRLLVDQINAAGGAVATAAANNRSLVVTGTVAGAALTVTAATDGAGGVTVTDSDPYGQTTFTPRGWERVAPPVIGMSARATDRLNHYQARQLAEESVFRYYQVICENPADPLDKSIPVGGLAGTITNPFRILMQGTRPVPVVPEPGLVGVLDFRTLQPFAATTYNGYSVDSPGLTFGSCNWLNLIKNGLLWTSPANLYMNYNLQPNTRLPVTFTVVDPEKMVVAFNTELFRQLGSGAGIATLPAELVIEVGAQILDTNGAPICYEAATAVPGGFGPDMTRVFGDIQQEVIATYDDNHNITGFAAFDADAANRAAYYGAGVAQSFQSPTGNVYTCDGIQAVPLNGKIRQVSWTISPRELETRCSTNAEFSRVIIPYPARRKAENLPVHVVRAAQNIASDFYQRSHIGNALNRVINYVRGKLQ